MVDLSPGLVVVFVFALLKKNNGLVVCVDEEDGAAVPVQ
jgi:hypothetical protein